MPGRAGFESYTPEEVDDALTAVIAHYGNQAAALRYLEEHGKRVPAVGTLSGWLLGKYRQRYEELRDLFADELEKTAANNMRDLVALAQSGTRMALEKEIERLEKGEEPDPARAAANMSKVAQSSVDKLMTLTSRPTQITETRNVEEILRSLVAKKVLTLPEGDGEGMDAGLDS